MESSLRRRTIADATRAIAERNGQLRAVLRVLDRPLRDASAPASAPLHDVPYVLKDTWDTAGIVTTGGSWRFKDRVPATSSVVFETFQRAGAVMLGKSSLCDLAFSLESDNHLLGPVSNPFDPERTSGGSTGGGAAAVAAGMAAFDWGSDFGGSIRLPSAFCGVVGLRLSNRSWPIPLEGFFPKTPELDVDLHGMGPLARSVAAVREVIAAAAPALRGKTAYGPFSPREIVVVAPDDRARGRWPTFVGDACRALVAADVGFRVDKSLPPSMAFDDAYNTYLAANFEAFLAAGDVPLLDGLGGVLLALASRGKLDRRFHPNTAALLALLALGRVTLYRDRRAARGKVDRVIDAMEALWAKGALVVAPVSTVPAPRHGRALLEPAIATFAKLGNLTDATAIALPFGRFDRRGAGMPRSLQILGPPGSEDAVLDLAARLESAA